MAKGALGSRLPLQPVTTQHYSHRLSSATLAAAAAANADMRRKNQYTFVVSLRP